MDIYLHAYINILCEIITSSKYDYVYIHCKPLNYLNTIVYLKVWRSQCSGVMKGEKKRPGCIWPPTLLKEKPSKCRHQIFIFHF